MSQSSTTQSSAKATSKISGTNKTVQIRHRVCDSPYKKSKKNGSGNHHHVFMTLRKKPIIYSIPSEPSSLYSIILINSSVSVNSFLHNRLIHFNSDLSILLSFSGIFSADAFWRRISSFVVLPRLPGSLELGDVIPEHVPGPESGDEVIELPFLPVGEGPVPGFPVRVPVAVSPVGFAEGLPHGAEKARGLFALHCPLFELWKMVMVTLLIL